MLREFAGDERSNDVDPNDLRVIIYSQLFIILYGTLFKTNYVLSPNSRTPREKVVAIRPLH